MGQGLTLGLTHTDSNELENFLNGQAFLFTAEEINKFLQLPLKVAKTTVQEQLVIKRNSIPIIFEIGNDQQKLAITSGDVETAHIIELYTNPEGILLEDIPEQDSHLWSYTQEDLLHVYQKLIKLLINKNSLSFKHLTDVKLAIKSIMHGTFSDRCQNYIPKPNGFGIFNQVQCRKQIALQTLLENPITKHCNNCYD